MMNLRGLGNLAKILEEAAKPDSVLREDREKPKPKVLKKGEKTGNIRVMDPKRKVWYEKRLKEITTKAAWDGCGCLGSCERPCTKPTMGGAIMSPDDRLHDPAAASGCSSSGRSCFGHS